MLVKEDFTCSVVEIFSSINIVFYYCVFLLSLLLAIRGMFEVAEFVMGE
jgi:hypothetical protein